MSVAKHVGTLESSLERRAMKSWKGRVQRRLKSLVSGRRGNLVALHITERGRRLNAFCPDDEVFTLSRELLLDRVYERGGFALDADIKTVVDAGAHAGIFSLQASQWAHQVVAIEASKLNFDLLTLNIDRNAIENIDARNRALWSSSGDMLSLVGIGNSGCGRVYDEPRSDVAGKTVESLSLDDLIAEIGPIDLLKIDIEGAEYRTINACTKLSSISTIVGEMHLENKGDSRLLESLIAKLKGVGFTVSVFTEKELYSRDSLTRLRKNSGSLQGSRLIKALVAAYYMAPIQKPLRPRGATYELPILVAKQKG
jgi:FkbM family methyltransferase